MRRSIKYGLTTVIALAATLLCAGYYMLGYALKPDELVTRSRDIEGSLRYVTETYPDVGRWMDSLQTAGALHDLYIENVEHWRGEDIVNSYKHTSADFLANPMYIIVKEIFSFTDSIYNLITGSVDTDPTGEPMAYEEILKGYAYDGSSGTYDLTIGLPTILQSNALTDLGLTIGTSEVGGSTYLSTINAVLGLASISGEAGGGIARIELNASLSSIGEDVFWNQEGNAYATYLAAHSGDAYTVL